MTSGATASPRVGTGRALVGVLIGVTMVTGVISSLGAPLIPSVARSLHISLQDAQWSLTAALVMACVAAPIMGRLGDGRYRRATIIGGLAVVLVGSIVAGLATSLPVLVLGRAMQGVGLGLAPVTMAAARDHLSAERAGSVIGFLSVAGPAATGAGYPISGLVDAELGLHAAFLFGGVIAAIGLIAAALVIPSSSARSAAPLDVPGAVVLSAGLVALLIAISEGERWGWSSPTVLGMFAGAVVLLAVWARLQVARAHPLVDLRQLRHRAVFGADLAAFALGLAFYMFLTLITEFVQEPHATGYGLGASAVVAGLCLVPFSAASLPTSRSIRSLGRRIDETTILIAGSLVIAASGAFFALVHGALWHVFVAMAVLGIGFGYTFAALPGMITRAVPTRETGSALGLYQVIRYVGFSLGSTLVGTILAAGTAGGAVSEGGYVNATWVAVAVSGLSALVTWAIARGGRPAPGRGGPGLSRDRDELAVHDGELAAAGLVGDEEP